MASNEVFDPVEAQDILQPFENPSKGAQAFNKIPLHIWFPDPDNPDAPRRPLPIQEEAWFELNEPHKHDMDVLFMLGGTGCFAAGTLIKMYDGSQRPVESIQIGELVLGHDGAPRRVTDLLYGKEKMYRVRPRDGGPEWTCNESHVLHLSDGGSRRTDISVRGYLATEEFDGWFMVRRTDAGHSFYEFELYEEGRDKYFGFQLDGPDCLFLLGDGTIAHNSGKTKGAVARCIYAAKKYRGAIILVGSTDYGHLERTVIKDYEKLLTIDDPVLIKKFGLRQGSWNHPFVKAGKEPKKHHKMLEFINGSVIHFMGIDEPGRVLSMEIDIFHFEEPQRLLNLDQFFDVAFTRLRNKAIPWKQLIMTANPNDDLGILWDRFDLDQFTEDYQGERRPIGKPCECHLCQKCHKKKISVEFVNGTCPTCGNKKKMACPGNQYFFRVIPCDSSDNFFVGETYDMNMRITMDKRKYDQLGKGVVRRHTKGRLYSNYNPQKHVLKAEKQININREKDLIWCLDHNNHPQSSVIVQEYVNNTPALVTVVEEMVLWGMTAEEVGEEFVKRFKPLDLKGNVLMYGDPSMFNGAIKGKVDHKFATIQSVLEDAGFRVLLLARPTRYAIKGRIDAVNRLLEDGNGTVRLRVNDRCEHVKMGLAFLEWHKNGKLQDDSVDDKARASGNFDIPHVMTHPMDALGYFIVEKYPIMEAHQEHPFILSTASSTLIELDSRDGELRQEKLEPINPHEPQEEEEEFDEFDDAEDEFEEEMLYAAKYETGSIAQMFRQQGLWKAKPSQNAS